MILPRQQVKPPMRGIALILMAMLASGFLLPAEEAAPPATTAPSTAAAASDSPSQGLILSADVLPAGYAAPRENVFRRFEIIAFGALPLTLFFTNFGFELYHFVDYDFDMSWAPWPFSGESTDSIDDSERFLRIGVAAGLALTVACVDALIRYLQDRKAARQADARMAAPVPGPADGGGTTGTPVLPGAASP